MQIHAISRAETSHRVAHPAGRWLRFSLGLLLAAKVAAAPVWVHPDKFETCELLLGEGTERTLPAALCRPLGEGPFPGVILVPGVQEDSGRGELLTAQPFRDLAEGLASRGIAVMRYEASPPSMPGALSGEDESTNSVQSAVGDALAALALARSMEGIRADALYVLGSNLDEGLFSGVGSEDGGVAGYVVLVGALPSLAEETEEAVEDPVFRSNFTITSQLDQVAARSGEVRGYSGQGGRPAIASQLERIALQAGEVRDLTLVPDSPAGALPAGESTTAWLRVQADAPVRAILALGRPVLVLLDGGDYASSGEALRLWREALGEGGDVQLKLTTAPDPPLGPEGPAGSASETNPGTRFQVTEAMIIDIAAWLRQRG